MKPATFFCSGCGKAFSFERSHPRCDACGEPLEVHCPSLKGARFARQGGLFERYRDFYPFSTIHPEVDLGEGRTPLIPSNRAGRELGMASLFFKNETQNPTWSFKDRGTAAGMEHALSLGRRRIGTVSTGNMAVSVAAYGSRAGLETFIFVSQGLPPEKVGPIAIYGPRLFRVEGDYSDLYFKSIEMGERFGVYFINSDVPFRVEGSKTIAFEICEQTGFRPPDYVAIPVSAGGNVRGILKGFKECLDAGLTATVPRMIVCQAAGCAPIVEAFERGGTTIERIQRPKTIAHAIENPYPPSGNEVLRKLRENGGLAVKVTDGEILEAQVLLAGEGIFGQPAAAVPLAGVKKLLAEKTLDPSASVVCVITGGGLKYTAALDLHRFDVRTVGIDRLGSVFEQNP
jgi:threonine synthase